MITYIHYGADHFYPELFMPARNGSWQAKPFERSGLWGSREDDPNGWKAWCEENKFHLEQFKHFFQFQMIDAQILTLESPDQLLDLPKIHPWEPKAPMRLETCTLPTMEQLEAWYTPNWCYLDYEKLAEQYDAIELRNHWEFRDAFPTWDCDCILMLKAERLWELD